MTVIKGIPEEHRAELITALEDELGRLKNGEQPTFVLYTEEDGWESQHGLKLSSLDDTLTRSFRMHGFCQVDDVWHEETVEAHTWGVFVPVRAARLVSAEPACNRCHGYDFHGEYGVVTLHGYEAPNTNFSKDFKCEDCEADLEEQDLEDAIDEAGE